MKKISLLFLMLLAFTVSSTAQSLPKPANPVITSFIDYGAMIDLGYEIPEDFDGNLVGDDYTIEKYFTGQEYSILDPEKVSFSIFTDNDILFTFTPEMFPLQVSEPLTRFPYSSRIPNGDVGYWDIHFDGLTTIVEDGVEPFFTIKIPALCDVMSALVFAFLVGLGIAYGKKAETLRNVAVEFRDLVEKAIAKTIIPFLPIYIFGIFLKMTADGNAFSMLIAFAKVIAVIFVLHIVILIYQFIIAGVLARRNPFSLLWTMLPAYMTALGTSSSAATIPVTLAQTKKNGVTDEIAGFTVPLCATIHLSGSTMKITACALAICMIEGLPHGFPTFMQFVAMLGIMMIAAPGVPGGAIMAALAPLGAILGFSAQNQALMIALYIAMDSFGTACNVTGDGAIAIAVQRLFGKRNSGTCSP